MAMVRTARPRRDALASRQDAVEQFKMMPAGESDQGRLAHAVGQADDQTWAWRPAWRCGARQRWGDSSWFPGGMQADEVVGRRPKPIGAVAGSLHDLTLETERFSN